MVRGMVFVEFVSHYLHDRKLYFVGKDIDSVTTDAKRMSFLRSSSYREVPQKDVERLKLQYFKRGVREVLDGNPSYYIGDRVQGTRKLAHKPAKKKGW